MQKLTIFIVNKLWDEECVAIKRDIIASLQRHFRVPLRILLDSKASFQDVEGLASATCSLGVFDSKDQDCVDYAMTVGGDGTLLYLMKKFQRRSSPPVFVFSKGTLGFLCLYDSKKVNEAIQQFARIINQGLKPPVQRVSRLRARIFSEDKVLFEYHCLNQITVSKNEMAPITLRLQLDGKDLTFTKGDGLIVSTPTGSTAYALSAGGPILSQENKSILVVPISPQSLSFRPIILPEEISVGICISKEKDTAEVTCDGQTTTRLSMGQRIEVGISEHFVSLVIPQHMEHPSLLFLSKAKNMLQWSKGFSSAL